MLNPEKSVPFEIKTLSKFECLSTKAWFSYVGDDRRSLSVTIQGENSQRILPRPARGGVGGKVPGPRTG